MHEEPPGGDTMSCTVESIPMESAVEKYREYDYALLYMMSELTLSKVAALGEIDWKECLEARFFSRTGELHVYRSHDMLKAVLCEETDDRDQAEKAFYLKKSYIPGKEGLIIC
jgi:hypothetical protein